MHTRIENSDDTSIIVIEDNQLLGNENVVLQNLVQESIANGSKHISVDLSNVKFVSSWGIEGFLHAFTTCKNKNVNFSLRNVNTTVNNVLTTLKLTELIKII